AWRLDDVARRVERGGIHPGKRRRSRVRLARRTVLEAAFVAAQALFDHQQGLVGAGIGIGRIRIGLECNSGIQMQCAVGAETETVLAQRDVAGIIAIEILAQDFLGALADAPAQGLANADAFSRDPESHFDASIGLVLRGMEKFGFWDSSAEPTLSDLAGMQSSRLS